MQDLSAHYTLVEEAIRQMGVDPALCRGQHPGQWAIRVGSANFYVDAFFIEKEARAYFQVMCPVLQIPPSNLEAFFRELLEINDKLFGVGFSVYNGWAWLKVIREFEGLDVKEALAMLWRVGNYSDQYDDYLIGKYGQPGGGPGGGSGPGGPPPQA